MSDVEDFGEGIELGNPAGFIARYIGEEVNATNALAEYRAAGGRITTQTWYQLYGEVSDTISRRGTFGATDPSALPDPAEYGTWTQGKGGQYATQVYVHFRDRETGLLGSQPFTYITDEPHTPDEAAYAATADYEDNSDTDQYNQQILGAVPTWGGITQAWTG